MADGVLSLTLRHPLGEELPGRQLGAHVDVVFGAGLERQYSLCGDPADRRAWRIAVLREPDGRGGILVCPRAVGRGRTRSVRGPRNHFALAPAARYRFVAGGIGITPLPMLAAAQAAARSGLCCTAGGHAVDGVHRGVGAVRGLGDRRSAGRVRTAGPRLRPDRGPRGHARLLLRSRPAAGRRGGALPRRAAPRRAFPAEVQETGGDGEFEVELARSGRTPACSADVSVLDTVRGAGVEVLFSCTEGTCGTCETDVLELHYWDSVLTDEEREAGETMLICVSRCLGKRLAPWDL